MGRRATANPILEPDEVLGEYDFPPVQDGPRQEVTWIEEEVAEAEAQRCSILEQMTAELQVVARTLNQTRREAENDAQAAREDLRVLRRSHVALEAANAELTEELAQTRSVLDHILNELEGARRVQSQFARAFATVEVANLELVSGWIPAGIASGDCLAVRELPRGVFLLVGDAVGHGSGPALVSGMVHGAVQALPERSCHRPARALQKLHTMLRRHGGLGFAGLAAVIDARRAQIRFANGGMVQPTLVSRWGCDQPRASVLQARGAVLGSSSPVPISAEKVVALHPGDLLAFHTDGVSECRNERGHTLGHRRLAEWLTELCDRPLEDVSKELIGRITDFVGQWAIEDDMVLVLARLG